MPVAPAVVFVPGWWAVRFFAAVVTVVSAGGAAGVESG
jgi:hypothetical protein